MKYCKAKKINSIGKCVLAWGKMRKNQLLDNIIKYKSLFLDKKMQYIVEK